MHLHLASQPCTLSHLFARPQYAQEYKDGTCAVEEQTLPCRLSLRETL